MRWIGICERSLELMCHRAATRALAPGTLLGPKQTVQSSIAESHAELEAARLVVRKAACAIDTRGAAHARDDISIIKFYVAGILQRVIDRAIQTHGALGMTDDLPLAYWFRHERAARIYDGADEVHKTVVSRRLLRKHGLTREAFEAKGAHERDRRRKRWSRRRGVRREPARGVAQGDSARQPRHGSDRARH